MNSSDGMNAAPTVENALQKLAPSGVAESHAIACAPDQTAIPVSKNESQVIIRL
jgi:hypothetical protein